MNSSTHQSAAEVIRKAGEKWSSSFVPRPKVGEFTGGLYSPRYLANKDSEGVGVKGAFKIGRQTCYPVESLCDWLIERLAG